MSKFSKLLIIKNLEIIKKLENNKLKDKAYNTVIENLKSYSNNITTLDDLKNIKGIGVNIHKLLEELYNTGEITYIKKLQKKNFNKNHIIELLEIIRDYEDKNNEKKKSKAYNTVIENLKSYPNDIKSLNDLENIKGIGESIYKMLEELYNKGKIGVVMSNTNPSRLGFEMISSGLKVIEYNSVFTSLDMPDNVYTKIDESSNILSVVKKLIESDIDNKEYVNSISTENENNIMLNFFNKLMSC